MHLFLESILGDRGHLWHDSFSCPYGLCPSQWPIADNKPPRMKFVQKLAPRVAQYRCKWCGCLLNKGFDGPGVPEPMWTPNTNNVFNTGRPSFTWNRY